MKYKIQFFSKLNDNLKLLDSVHLTMTNKHTNMKNIKALGIKKTHDTKKANTE